MNINKTNPRFASFAVSLILAGGLLLPAARAAQVLEKPAPRPAVQHPLCQPKPAGTAANGPAASPAAGPAARPAAPTKNNKPAPTYEDPKKDGKEYERRKHLHEHEIVIYGSVPGGYSAEADLLRKAYVALSKADHDYDGHRIMAMDQTADAARIFGETLGGDGHFREAQMTSDAELRAADGFLGNALSLAVSHKHPRIVEHINVARREIAIALNIR